MGTRGISQHCKCNSLFHSMLLFLNGTQVTLLSLMAAGTLLKHPTYLFLEDSLCVLCFFGTRNTESAATFPDNTWQLGIHRHQEASFWIFCIHWKFSKEYFKILYDMWMSVRHLAGIGERWHACCYCSLLPSPPVLDVTIWWHPCKSRFGLRMPVNMLLYVATITQRELAHPKH